MPRTKLKRDEKRPLVYYTEVLNELSDMEWEDLKLPPVTSVRHSSNRQLADLDAPSFFPVKFAQITSPTPPPSLTTFVNGLLSPSIAEHGCHMECFADINGDVVCLHEEDTFEGVNSVAYTPTSQIKSF